MKLKSVFILTIFITMSLGCVASHEDVRGVYARQIRLETRVNQLSQDFESLKREVRSSGESSETRFLREQIAQLEERLKNLEESNSELKEKLNQLSFRQSSPQSGVISKETQTPPLPSSEARLYSEAYKNLSEGNYKKAREQFSLFRSQYPNSTEAPDALFWIAESYYREGKFEEAILEFQRFIDTYPKDERIPLSYLKQGLSLINIGREEEAKLFLQTLIDKFPKSDEAAVAKEKLRELARKS